ncbi:thioredoxin family protein [Caenispirillum salinarum]|uniref:thioredoxin family protein n=1 Tax=Caenispirillum salinarum TaxID=859058 RepID=UPI00384E4C85
MNTIMNILAAVADPLRLRSLALIEKKAADLGIEVEVEKVTDMGAIMGYGVMSTPGVVIDETVVHAGGIPKAEAVEAWLND